MNILFAHNNFPGQFHRLAVALAASPANKVVFLSQYRRSDVSVPGVEWVQVPLAAEEQHPSSARRKYLNLLARGERFADAMLHLARQGFKPDVIYGHVGFGCCIYAPDIFPQAMQMGYFEWYYTNQADTRFFCRQQARFPDHEGREPPVQYVHPVGPQGMYRGRLPHPLAVCAAPAGVPPQAPCAA